MTNPLTDMQETLKEGDRIRNVSSKSWCTNNGKFGVVTCVMRSANCMENMYAIRYDDGSEGRGESTDYKKVYYSNNNIMFNKNAKYDKEREKDYARKEVELYKQSEMLRIDNLVSEYRSKAWLDLEKIALDCAVQQGTYENTFHEAKEEKGIELSKLDATIEARRAEIGDINNYVEIRSDWQYAAAESRAKDIVIATLKEQIKAQDDNIKVVIGRIPKVEIDKVGITVATTSEKK